jgi:hypothetical protein
MKEKTSSIYPPVCVGPHNTASSTPYLGEEEKTRSIQNKRMETEG